MGFYIADRVGEGKYSRIARVCRAFVAGREAIWPPLSKGDCASIYSSITSRAGTLYSYAMPIALRRPDGVIEIVEGCVSPSPTTDKHILAVCAAAKSSARIERVYALGQRRCARCGARHGTGNYTRHGYSQRTTSRCVSGEQACAVVRLRKEIDAFDARIEEHAWPKNDRLADTGLVRCYRLPRQIVSASGLQYECRPTTEDRHIRALARAWPQVFVEPRVARFVERTRLPLKLLRYGGLARAIKSATYRKALLTVAAAGGDAVNEFARYAKAEAQAAARASRKAAR